MKPAPTPELEKCRVRSGIMASDSGYGNNGVFRVRTPDGVKLQIIASDGLGWEHVSISPTHEKRTPTWDEMCFVKNLFWEPEEVVVQYHPAESEYVNLHPYVLHLWKPIGVDLPAPPSILVGPRQRHR